MKTRAQPASRPAIVPSTILQAFDAAEERVLLVSHHDLVWIEELLQIMEAADWGWADLDLHGLTAILLDGFRWTMDRAPDDPAAVARALGAFLTFAGRSYGAPHVEACCAYLGTPGAVRDIRAWLRPRTRTMTGRRGGTR